MRVLIHWSGGKDCCTACHKAIEMGHEVAYLVTYIYTEPYIFHSLKVAQLQSKALGIPHIKVKIEGDRFKGIFDFLSSMKKEEKIEGLVTGDIDNVPHKKALKYMCKKLNMKLITPLWDRRFFSLLPGNRYRKRVLNMELSAGIKSIISCIDLNYLEEQWLGREFNKNCVLDMRPLVGPWGVGIDAAGEPGEFHTTVLDAPLFKQSIEITRFNKKKKELDFGGWPKPVGNFLYMDIEECFLKPKNGKCAN